MCVLVLVSSTQKNMDSMESKKKKKNLKTEKKQTTALLVASKISQEHLMSMMPD